MKITTRTFYTVHVNRPITGKRYGTMIQYSAEEYPSLADARVAAKKLGEYSEIRRVRVVHKSGLVERVEQ